MAQSEATLILKIKQVGQEILDRFVITLGDVIGIAKSVGGAIVDFGKESVQAFREQELALNQLTQAMVQQGIFTQELQQNYIDMAGALQRTTTFSDDQIMSAQALLQAQIGQMQITPQLVEATLDLAAAKGMDLKSASDLVGKSIGTENNALARHGILIKEGATESERFGLVIDQLNSKFGGQARALAQGLGSLDQLKNQYNDLQEQFGAGLAPTISALTKIFTDWLVKLNESNLVTPIVQGLIDGLTDAAILTKFLFESAVAAASGNIAQVVASYAQMKADMAAIDQEAEAQSEALRLREQQNVAASEQRKTQIIAEKKAQRKEQELIEHETGLAEQEVRDMEEAARIQSQIDKINQMRQRQIEQERLQKAGMMEFSKYVNSEEVKSKQQTLGQIATLSTANNKALAAIGKAAAIAQITINTAQGISLAFATFPWPASIAVAALVGVAGAVQMAKVAGVQLAEGGIVPATPGGVPAVIGEGGRDEAVIPLEDGMPALGGGITINVNGGLMGDASQARQFALKIDEELMRLRRKNQSSSFDSGIT